jgi:hypothetical protein
MSFEDRIKQHNTYLQRWIAWIPHQVTVSKLIYLKIARCNLLREKRRAKRNWQARFAKSCQQKDFHAPTTPTPKDGTTTNGASKNATNLSPKNSSGTTKEN